MTGLLVLGEFGISLAAVLGAAGVVGIAGFLPGSAQRGFLPDRDAALGCGSDCALPARIADFDAVSNGGAGALVDLE